MRRDISPGDLVVWQIDIVVGELTETGVVMEIVDDDNGNPGAKVAWSKGVYWSPIELIRNVRDYYV